MTKAELARIEGVSTRTIMRRVADGLLEPPEVINGRLYWWVNEASSVATTTLAITDTAAAKAARNPGLRRKGAQTSSQL